MNQENFEQQLLEMEQQHHFALSKISHEIRNPVTLIHSFLQLIEAEHPEATHFQYWDSVIDSTDFLMQLLNSISSYNKAEVLHVQPLNLYRLLENITTDAANILSKQNIQIRLLKESALPPIDADPVKIKEVIHNLIRNSAEAIGKDGTITISISYDNMFIVLKIADDGPGIPAEYLPGLFDPFVTHKKDGTGLGLAITKNVITAHNGTIDVQSQEGNGTVFILRLPI